MNAKYILNYCAFLSRLSYLIFAKIFTVIKFEKETETEKRETRKEI